MKNSHSSRIVVTGMGTVSPLGCGVDAVWSRLVDSQSGVKRLNAEFAPDVPCQVAGRVPLGNENDGFDVNAFVSAKDLKKMDRFIAFALGAAAEAIAQARWYPKTEAERARTATVIASGIGGFPAIAEAVRVTDDRGTQRLSPFTIPSFLSNMAAGWISIQYGYKGPLGAPTTACAASVQAIGDAARLIRAGEADIAICGGTEAAIDRVSLGGFAAARALSSNFNDNPQAASRPFDSARDGFVMGEGAGVVVIESLEHALARGVVPLAELVGYGTSADAFHLTAGPDTGEGAARAMHAALTQAGTQPSAVRHINAHATSTPVGDRGELAAIKTIFGERHGQAISATKSATGHMLGAAGGVEAIFTIMALRKQLIPPTLNLIDPDPLAAGLDIVGPIARAWEFDYAISNGFGFGGVNASVLFKRWAGA